MSVPILVPADLEESIRQKVANGDYDDPSEVIRAAMSLLERRDQRLAEVRALVAEGLASVERGEVRELTPELWDELEREAEEQIRRGVPPHPDVCP
jgi:putative addiction module CopG family antidote